jgi:hypothetical protein
MTSTKNKKKKKKRCVAVGIKPHDIRNRKEKKTKKDVWQAWHDAWHGLGLIMFP